jgi:hypothetical protein
MSGRAIIILHVGEEYVAQVSLAEYDDMIKAFLSDRPDQRVELLCNAQHGDPIMVIASTWLRLT